MTHQSLNLNRLVDVKVLFDEAAAGGGSTGGSAPPPPPPSPSPAPTPTPDLPPITSFSGSDLMVINAGGVDYKSTLDQFANWFIPNYDLNSVPQNSDTSQTQPDTAIQMSGNLFALASDRDGDALQITFFSYNGTSEVIANGSFTTALGVMFVNPTTGDWTFTLGQGARALNTGQTGIELFTYTLADGKGGIVTKNLTLFITGTNQAPVVNYVNGMTPINTVATGNLLKNYVFDYETTPTISQFLVQGDATVYAAGSTATITGVGTLVINTNGDYTFTPALDFFGPVPLVTYRVTDGVNNVDAYFTFAVTPMVPGTAPILICSDVVAGPISGGENNLGQYLTLWGFRMGVSGDLGGSTKLYIGAHEVANYRELVTDVLDARFPGMQRLTVQVGAIGNPPLGVPLPITLVTAGGTSNASNIFTPNPGNFYFVSLTGDDSTGVVNDITKPFRHLQLPNRSTGGVYPLLHAGDTVVIRGGTWQDLGYDTAWFRFRDPQQQGSNPNGTSGTGWIAFIPYPGETVHYVTPTGGNKGGFQGPGQAFAGTCGEWIVTAKLRMEVPGGSTRDAAPINMQYNIGGHWRAVGNNLGPWVAGSSSVLNAACITGQGNFILLACNYLHDVEGTSDLQNHGVYAGTSSYGWELMFNWSQNMVGGSHFQFNDSDGGTGTFPTAFGTWQGFTNIKIHHNFLEHSAKYGIIFADIGANQGDLSFLAWNNIILKTGLPPMRLNTTTSTSTVLYAFNTIYDCNTVASGGNAMFRNEGNQSAPQHHVMIYDNVVAFGPDTVAGTQWFSDVSGQSSGYDPQRNVWYSNGQSPTNWTADGLAIYADPLFTNTATLDFSLQSGSPAINSGTKSLGSLLTVLDDFTGLATRLYGGAPDCGAVETIQNTPYLISTPVTTGGPQVLVATNTGIGSWGNSPVTVGATPAYSRQYTVADISVGVADTGTGNITYTPVGADAGKVLKCVFAVSNAAGTTPYTLVIGTIAVGAGAPVNTAAPTLSAPLYQSGQVLTALPGTWTGASISGYLYQFRRTFGGVTTNIGSSTSTSTYTMTGSDVGCTMSVVVTAVDTVNGNVSAASAQTSVISAAPADPVIVQAITNSLVGTGNTVTTFGSDVNLNNWILLANATWDNAAFNATITDTQGNTNSSIGNTTYHQYGGSNPWLVWRFVKSTATAAYSVTWNPNGGSGGTLIGFEIGNTDPSTLQDIPSDYNEGTSSSNPSLVGSIPNTKAKDLVLVVLQALGSTANTFTPNAGWNLEQTITAAFHTLFVCSRKESTVETFSFGGTLGTAVSWSCASLVIKGS